MLILAQRPEGAQRRRRGWGTTDGAPRICHCTCRASGTGIANKNAMEIKPSNAVGVLLMQ